MIWQHRHNFNNGSVCKVSVDGSDFCISQPKPFDSMWYSHKFKGSGVRDEVALFVQGGDIVWLSGQYSCEKWSNISIFCHGLKSALLPGNRIEADLKYRGDSEYVTLPEDNIFGNPKQQTSKAMVWSRHETCNHHFKEW